MTKINKFIVGAVTIIVLAAAGYFIIIRNNDQSAAPIQKQSNETDIKTPESTSQPGKPSTTTTPTTTSQRQAPAEKEKIVTYTDSGYSPASLTIKKGENVVFRNQSSDSMWPASAFHPTHKEYPTTGGCLGSTFDACKGVQPGNTWSFKFDIAGTWKYHDHLSPTKFGVIKVE